MTVYEVLLSMLSDPDHTVRVKMVAIIRSLFSREGQPLPSSEHERIFTEDICSKLEVANLVDVGSTCTCS